MRSWVRSAAAVGVLLGSFFSVGSRGAAAQSIWLEQSIGAPAISGSATLDSDTFTITAAGTGVSGRSDEFHFVYQPIGGDVDIRARVDNLSPADPWSKAGVMIRGSLAPDAAHGFALVSAEMGTHFQRRARSARSTTRTAGADVAAPEWVRLVRRGNTVSAYTSTDGASWSLISSDTITLGATAYVGLAVTSQDAAIATSATLSQVSITPVVSATAVGLPVGQQAADIGAPAITGSTSYANGTYQIHAGGRDVWGTSDQFHFVYQQASGDLDVRLRVNSMTLSASWAKAGVMIRETLTAGSNHGFAALSANQGFAFHRRPVANGTTVSTSGSQRMAPGWVRLTRFGTLFTAYESVDGQTWTSIASDSIPMADTVYVGIAVTSQNVSTAIDVVADALTITETGSGNLPPSVTLSSPASNATFTAPASITMTANAADPENQLTRVEFYNGTTLLGSDTTAPYAFTWSSVPAGSYSLTARAYDAAGQNTTSAAVSITVTAANQPPTVSLSSPANNATFAAPATITIAANAADPESQLTRVEFYNGPTLLGSDTTAPYAFTWSAVPAGSYSLTARAYDAAGLTTASAAVNITVTANQPPTVAITSPANNATFAAPANITITATAADPENQLTRVEFYRGSTLIGSDTTAPYAVTWSAVPAGSYSLTARAYDGAGLTTTSAAVTITVTAAANQPPTVSITSPANNATFTAPASITITANATDAENQLNRVEFYNGTALLGSDTSAPYAFTWGTVAAGTYALRAIAVDNAGASGSSATVSVTVSGAASGLVAAYGLNEGTGTTVNDNSGTGPTGVMSGASWVAGRYGQALSLNGVSSVVAFGDVDLTGSFTVMGWMQTRQLYSNTCASFVMKAFDYGFEVCNGSLRARIGSGNGWSTYAIRPLTTADLNVWKHLAMTYDGTTVRMYIDGVLINSATGAHVSNNNPLLFGRWTPASEYWDGVVDEVRIYNRMLSQAEVQTDMTTPIGGGPANQAPTATLTAPANGAAYTAPASITMTATASDADGSVARVDFYNGTTLLGSDSTAPYAFTWSSVAAGTYALKATAVDNAGASGSSSVASVTVTGPNQPPTVSLSSPANNATFAAPATITITGNAADPENQLTRVEFYNGATLLGSDTTAPYAFTWSAVPVGSYSLTARAYDAAGLTTTSAAVNITVTANQPPTVAITSPANNATFTAAANITITASAADPENQVTRVEFYRGTTLLGSDTTAPYAFTWAAVPAGTYSLTARAYDAAGLTTTSAAVNITVTAVADDPPTTVVFQASVDHAIVTSYQVEVFAQGANPDTATPIAATDVGKPAPNASNDISVAIPTFFAALAPGTYQLTVAARNAAGVSRSVPVTFVR